MAEKTEIAWTDATFNPWIGCTRVSEGCRHCYAETLARNRMKIAWGPSATRKRTSDAYWRQPMRWQRKGFYSCPVCSWRGDEEETDFHLCPRCGEYTETGFRRVFCASLADVFEDNPQVTAWRNELFDLVARTPALEWLMLTKRPENIAKMWQAIPPNVWLGATVEDQAVYAERVTGLLQIIPNMPRQGNILFLSIEPMLGPISLNKKTPVDWVICGGESGPDARPLDLDWVRDLQAQCKEQDIRFFFKQFGTAYAERHSLRHRAGADESEFPPEFQGLRAFPSQSVLKRIWRVYDQR